MHPTAEADRIETLDVFRGFALLGILLLNIIGFGLYSGAYSYPGFDVLNGSQADLVVWGSIELFAEGAMRCLFSILFGAGVLLFVRDREDRGWLHYRRTFLLAMFGLADLYLLLWNGDILFTYALVGFLLYPIRKASARSLLIGAGVLILLMSLMHLGIRFGLQQSEGAYQQVVEAEDVSELSDAVREAAKGWQDFSVDYYPDETKVAEELAARQGSYVSAFQWNLGKANEMLLMVLPMFLFWDALAMMLIGMALYRMEVLQGARSPQFYLRLMVTGFTVGLTINALEVYNAWVTQFDIFHVFAQMQATYHIGRLAVALGYIGLLGWICSRGLLTRLRGWLAPVGRLALTNYLMQSLLCLFIFTGAGLGLVGELPRSGLYPIVLLIWVFQLVFSKLWIKHFVMGPLEWCWRAMTYGELPVFRRT